MKATDAAGEAPETPAVVVAGISDANPGLAALQRQRRPRGLPFAIRKIGHVVVNSSIDRPWSQYFCCLLAGNRDFVAKHPIATKRVLRAILKATDFCAGDAAAAARRMVDGGFTDSYDAALQMLNEVPYNKWRVYDPDDTLRFYALRLREAGMIKSSPGKILADGTDWRFLNELKRELKG